MNTFPIQPMILADEYEMLATTIAETVEGRHHKQTVKGDFYFLSDSCFLCDYLMRAVAKVSVKRTPFGMGRVRYLGGTDDDYRNQTLTDLAENADTVNTLNELSENDQVFVFADCIDGLSAREDTLRRLDTLFTAVKQTGIKKIVVTLLMPEIPDFPQPLTALAERELDYYLAEKAARTPEIDYYLELFRYLRTAEAETEADISVLCFSNVFAPDRCHLPKTDLFGAIKKAFDDGAVHLTAEDFSRSSCFTYVRNAGQQIFAMLTLGKKGHVYHGNGTILTPGKLLSLLHELYSEKIGLTAEIAAGVSLCHDAPDPLKISRLAIKDCCTLASALRHLVSYHTGLEYDMTESVAFYHGKIKTIQALEIEILREIDRICRKHHIKYFLAGGTLLGSVRNGEPIEWDDDLDIGMLRDDYEKFRKVCEAELGDRFLFSGLYNHSGNHYTIEKIRLKSTWFSTRFSAENVYDDGIFVDILVYDQTTENSLRQKWQVLELSVLTTLIYIRWFNKPRQNYHFWFSVLALPFLRLIPFSLLHRRFDHVARRFRRKKNATLLIDTVGKKLMDGPLPIEGLTEVKDVEFAGLTALTPENPVPYLNYAYGARYMEKPVFSKRRCPHNFARIDLGAYVFGEMNPTYRTADLRGELFEKD